MACINSKNDRSEASYTVRHQRSHFFLLQNLINAMINDHINPYMYNVNRTYNDPQINLLVPSVGPSLILHSRKKLSYLPHYVLFMHMMHIMPFLCTDILRRTPKLQRSSRENLLPLLQHNTFGNHTNRLFLVQCTMLPLSTRMLRYSKGLGSEC